MHISDSSFSFIFNIAPLRGKWKVSGYGIINITDKQLAWKGEEEHDKSKRTYPGRGYECT